MKLVFLYYADGPAPTGGTNDTGHLRSVDYNSVNKFIRQFPNEGLYPVLQELLSLGLVDDVLVFVESTHGTGRYEFPEGKGRFKALVAPEIRYLEKYLSHNDIVWTRGGFRTWFPFLCKMQDQGRWMWLYGANTGRERWIFWDIVFDDLTTGGHRICSRSGRVYLKYIKPILERGFVSGNTGGRPYDLMIGASHIHAKKGQLHVLNALKELADVNADTRIKALIPGGAYDRKSHYALEECKNRRLVDHTGMVSRERLGELMRQTKIAVFAGGGGQNDRGPIEAMAAGCQLMIATPGRHGEFVSSNPAVTYLLKDVTDPRILAIQILRGLRLWKPSFVQDVVKHYEATQSFEICMKLFIELFEFFNQCPKRDMEKLYKYFNLSRETL